MSAHTIPSLRLSNQLIASSSLRSPAEVVQWLGAVQSQDYPAAKWALGLRLPSATDTAVEQAFNQGAILRTHVLRPTWHFVNPQDLRWMLTLTAPRVKAAMASQYRRLELDGAVFTRTHAVLEKALQGGHHLTRAELTTRLEQAGLLSPGEDLLRVIHILATAEVDGLITSGALRGKQHTYALLEERVPAAPILDRDAALAELARRYFTSRGPATIKDYTWWSGLSPLDARAGLEMVKPQLVEELFAGQSYWLHPSSFPPALEGSPAAHLLPNYDEYIVSYADRSAIFDPSVVRKVDERGNFLFNHTILLDGQVAGVWKRTLKKTTVEITPNLFTPFSAEQTSALTAAMEGYSRFLGLPLQP